MESSNYFRWIRIQIHEREIRLSNRNRSHIWKKRIIYETWKSKLQQRQEVQILQLQHLWIYSKRLQEFEERKEDKEMLQIIRTKGKIKTNYIYQR